MDRQERMGILVNRAWASYWYAYYAGDSKADELEARACRLEQAMRARG